MRLPLPKVAKKIGRKMTALALAGVAVFLASMAAVVVGEIKLAWVFLTCGGLILLSAVMVAYEKLLTRTMEIRAQARVRQSLAAKPVNAVERAPSSSVATFGPYYGFGPAYEYAIRGRRAKTGFETFALRTRSIQAREVLARGATNLQFGYGDLLSVVRTHLEGYAGPDLPLIYGWNQRTLLSLARVIANQRLDSNDIDSALSIYKLAIRLWGYDVLGKTDRYIYIECLTDSADMKPGEVESALKVSKLIRRDPVHSSLIKANAIRSQINKGEATWEDWVDAVNKLFATESLSPIRIQVGLQGEPLDCLTAVNGAKAEEGPRVSVIVPTFNASSRIRTALNALHDQTWTNLEIIIVDDGSDESTRQLLRGLVPEYPNARLIELDKNYGTYVARNRGAKESTGEFVTVHDDDDWSHPAKIEMQVRHLLSNPQVPANMTRHVRTTEDLIFTRININPSFSQPNFSSLMFRRDLFDDIGWWDEVNRGGDAEFRDRIEAITGERVEILGDVPASFTRVHSRSLTSNEINRGYVDPARLFYQSAYQRAHKALTLNSAQEAIEYARPVGMLPQRRDKYQGDLDIIYVTDFRFPGGTSTLTLNEIEAAYAADLKVGIIHVESPLNGVGAPLVPDVLDIASRGKAIVLSLQDRVSASAVIVRHPTVLQFADNLTSNIKTKRIWVIANNPPILKDGTGAVYDADSCLRNAEYVFGAPATLVPESGVTRELVQAFVKKDDLSSFDWPGFISSDSFSSSRKARLDRRPVVGRHSRDDALKWPDTAEELLYLYCGNSAYDVQILGGVSTLPKGARERLKQKSTVFGFNEIPVKKFLNGLDFWVYFHSKQLVESFGMATVEAMACGLVVILPDYMSGTFGTGAIYAAAEDVPDLVTKYWRWPELYERQSHEAIRVARTYFSESAYLSRLEKLGVAASEAGDLSRGPNGGRNNSTIQTHQATSL